MTNQNEYPFNLISSYMFLPDDILPADVTIVLGQTLWERPLLKAVEVYLAGVSGQLIFTGGFNPKINNYEAQLMKDAWIRMGYPPDQVYIDTRANNTAENMLNSIEIMKKIGLFQKTTLVNLISINYHMRRAVETLKHVGNGNLLQIGAVNYPSKYCDPLSWFANPIGRSLVFSEITKIKKYLPDLQLDK